MPFWHMDAAMASLLILQTAVDEGLGACFFGIPPERRRRGPRGVRHPRHHDPIGAITIGHPADEARARLAEETASYAPGPKSSTADAGRSTVAPVTTARRRLRRWSATGRSPSSRRWSGSRPSPTATRRWSTRPPSTGSSTSSRAQFPLLHERLELTRIDTHGLLFHWRGRADDRPVVLMAHLDVVPGRGRVAAPAVRRRHRGRRDLGSRHARRQGLRWSAICEAVERLLGAGLTSRRRTSGCRSAATRRCSGTAAAAAVDELDAAASARGSCSTRAARSRTTRSPASARRRRHRRDREGRHVPRAARRGPRRTRLDARRGSARRRGSPGRSCGSTTLADARPRPGADARADAPAGPARAAAAAAADGQRRPARAGAHPRPARRRPRDGGDDPHHVRGHDALGVAGPQRDRRDARPPASTSGSWSATPSRAVLDHVRTAIGDDQVRIDVVEAGEP